MPDSFEDRVLEELRKQYPALKDEFIQEHQSELMELLRFGKSKVSTIDDKAAAISDSIPDELFQGLSLTDTADSTQLVPADKRILNCVELLNIFMGKVLSGEVESLCIQSIKRDGGMEMLFTIPCNVYAYLGFMQHAVGKSMNMEFRDPREEV